MFKIRAYLKGRLQLESYCREVCNIYGEEDLMSFSTVYRWVAKFKSGLQQIKDAACNDQT